MDKVVHAASMEISSEPDDILVAGYLGSCVGITVYDPGVPLGGILLFMLPCADKIEIDTAGFPYMFADKAIPAFLNAMYHQGARRERLKLVAAGGSQVLLQDVHLNVGKDNATAARKTIDEIGLHFNFEDFGGFYNRSMTLLNQTGETLIESIGRRVVRV